MTMKHSPASVMERIAIVDRSGLTTRDVRILDCIINQPGQCGNDIVLALGLHCRSSIQANLPKLIKHGMIEDHRLREGQAIPGQFHITEKGREFWERITK